MAASGTYIRRLDHRAAARRLGAALALGMALALSGCAVPPAGKAESTTEAASTRSEPVAEAIAAAPAAAPPPTTTPPPRNKPAPPMSDPLPAQRVPAAAPSATAPKLDLSCRTSADCAVKDVGNCCGYFPRCVNVNAAVDPKAVQAQCARSGMMSVCGFKSVESCECVKGECQDRSMALEAQ